MRTLSKKTRSCSKSRNQEIKLETISFELVIEILLRLPVKSIARYRTVSKLWESTLASPYFTESFFTISSSRPPKLLFTCLKDNKTFFFSSSSPPCPPRPPIVANFHTSFSINCPYNRCRPVRGLVCGLYQQTSKGSGTATLPLICNPSTDEVITLPRVKTRRKGVKSFFGYDPINKHFKVLCMTKSLTGGVSEYSEEHQLLTLETGKKTSLTSWKMIKCDVKHTIYGYSQSDNGICINGVLYYLAYITGGDDGFPDIVCFDIRSEEFSYIRKADQGMNINIGAQLESTLVNYKGKLAKLQANIFNYNILTGIQLWVLEDAEKHKWSSYIYVMPRPWKNITKENTLCFVGTTSSGEIVLSPNTICDVFYLVYYKPESNTISKVVIKGMEAFMHHKPYIFLDHVEDVKILSNV
ncbi:F-box protein [Cardamine amara subsp. amara]|uniref:F-box protein n=1 Tax=Cardamine amara subsp. amara TaxID=228776 RepID=A0ABD1BPT0_CARAN